MRCSITSRRGAVTDDVVGAVFSAPVGAKIVGAACRSARLDAAVWAAPACSRRGAAHALLQTEGAAAIDGAAGRPAGYTARQPHPAA